MTSLNIYKVDDNNDNLITTLPIGEHLIGRGPLLQCDDKRVSRQHALIKVNENGASIQSVHINPCFYLSGAGKNVTILPKNEDIPLNDSDKFSLCVDSFWYRVELVKNNTEPVNQLNNNHVEQNELNKTTEESENDEQETKEEEEIKQELESNDETAVNQENGCSGSNKRPNDSVEENNAKKIKTESSENDIKIEPSSTNVEEVAEAGEGSSNAENKVKDENVETESNAEVPSRRERCWYGVNCYRKCGNHRENFSHPGDADYDSDSNDNRPSCSYGAACYRRNMEHRRDFKHPPGKPAKKDNSAQNKAKRKVTQNKKAGSNQNQNDYDDDEDDYDLEDPFIDDNSSDNYEVSSSGSDSDWDDSANEPDEDEEEKKVRKRLIKEAKKFTKKK